jgi:hypothetical protein
MPKSASKILFVPFYIQSPHLRTSASARIRAEWPAKYLGADIIEPDSWQCGNSFFKAMEYDLVIFQKCYNQNFQAVASELKRAKPEIKLAFDLCDAEWLNREEELKAMINLMDFVVASTNQIKKWVQRNFPDKICYKIPDGHDLEYYFDDSFSLTGEIGIPGPMKYVWYGNCGTIKSLKTLMPTLERITGKGDTLTIIADERARGAVESQKIGVKFVVWGLDTVNNEVRQGNLVLNPRLDTVEYAVKSNNKTVMAYILGLPCIDRLVSDEKGWMADLIKFRNPEFRIADVAQKRPELIAKYSMENVGKMWGKVIAKELEKC